jgi:tRNA G18 (ribose-2'-O)-methylase SpoU
LAVPVIPIDSEDDQRLADYLNVPDAELVERRGIFVAEGRFVVRRLLEESPLAARSVMVTDAALASIPDLVAARPNLPVYRVSQTVMNGVTGFDIHRGCLAIGERPAPAPWSALVAHARTILVLERIGNADNVGGIFRNAIAFGADAILIGPACADPLYRKAIRTSMGAALLVPFAHAEPWLDALRQLRGLGFASVALTPSADAPSLSDAAANLKGSPVAIVLGHEGEGLTAEALEACEHRARIPMSGFDSLNVASAAAVALYELKRDA